MTAYEQRSYTGAAADTLLNADLTSGGLSFSVTPGTGAGYPDGTQGPFHVFIDYDNSKIEKIRCSGRVNDTFTVAATGGGRGQDGTTAQEHTANAKVRHGPTATDIQEANRAAANTVGLITSKGDLLAGTGANALTRLPVGANGTLPVADSTQASGLRYTNSGLTFHTPTLDTPTITGAAAGPGWSIDGSGRVLGSQPHIKVSSNGQHINVSTNTALTWAAVEEGVSAMWAAGNPTRIVAPVAGTYHFQAAIWTSNQNDPGKTTTRIRYRWRKNGVDHSESWGYSPAYNGACPAGTPAALIVMSANDYAELFAESLDSAIDVNTGDFTHVWLSAHLISG